MCVLAYTIISSSSIVFYEQCKKLFLFFGGYASNFPYIKTYISSKHYLSRMYR